ncbi:MAG: flagellar protein, partial [Pseudorhodoplanes sp.]|nr:flagellar protein [Pseudorhodoplanes sp.]
MASNITLSSSVRQNLLSLQNTAALSALTQNRLATGKKVNSALDNPVNFFTSQSLNNRASDLNSLLDSIGQATQTLKAADQGITSVTKLVESAKSIAKQARQAPQPTSATYNAVVVSGDPTDEAIATTGNGTALTVANAQTYSFEIDIAGTGVATVSYTSDASATYGEILAGLQSSFATALAAASTTTSDLELVANAGGDGIRVNAVTADSSTFVVTNSASAGIGASTYTSTSLFENIGTTGTTLTVAVNGGANQVIAFGTGLGEVSTLAELQTKLNTISGITTTAGNSAVSVTLNSSSSQNSLLLTSSNAALTTALGLGSVVGTTYAGTATVSTPNSTRTSLQADYDNVITQIDALSADASYNGVNLLGGDDLKVVFNETGTSSLTITGVTFNSAGLGLGAISGAGFQSDGDIDAVIVKLDTALSSLRTQASKFGSNLSTVQTRQDFTKNLINTLQTGADNLVLADTNEEGANLLALQTRQQLSTTALSLSAQADQ